MISPLSLCDITVRKFIPNTFINLEVIIADIVLYIPVDSSVFVVVHVSGLFGVRFASFQLAFEDLVAAASDFVHPDCI